MKPHMKSGGNKLLWRHWPVDACCFDGRIEHGPAMHMLTGIRKPLPYDRLRPVDLLSSFHTLYLKRCRVIA